jgi:hypothetical protein
MDKEIMIEFNVIGERIVAAAFSIDGVRHCSTDLRSITPEWLSIHYSVSTLAEPENSLLKFLENFNECGFSFGMLVKCKVMFADPEYNMIRCLDVSHPVLKKFKI